jgi:hypothetical protein
LGRISKTLLTKIYTCTIESILGSLFFKKLLFLFSLALPLECGSIRLSSYRPCEPDVVFLIDSSLSFTPDDYEKLRNELSKNLYELVPTNANIGIVQYGFNGVVEVNLNSGSSNEEYKKIISNMQQVGGITLLFNGLNYVYENMFLTSSFSSEKHLIVVTDGPVSLFFFSLFFSNIIVSSNFSLSQLRFQSVCVFLTCMPRQNLN